MAGLVVLCPIFCGFAGVILGRPFAIGLSPNRDANALASVPLLWHGQMG